MTRALVLTNMYPPHHLGGYELLCRDFVEHWRGSGHEATVLTTTMRLPGVVEDDDEEAEVRRDLDFYWEDHRIVAPRPWRALGMERRNQRVLREALADVRPDVVSVWHMGAMSLGLLTTLVEAHRRGDGPPSVYVICDDWLVYAPDLDAWARRFLHRPRLAGAVRRLAGVPTAPADIGADGTFCFISDFTRRRAERKSRWDPERSTVVYSGIHHGDFPPPAPDGREWRWRLLCVGRLDERKGIHVALRGLTRLPEEATLEILGRGDETYAAELRRLAGELGVADRVRFSAVSRAELAERYRDADVFLFPVLWDEPFGLVPVEAMACGTPVVATATGGSAEFLADEVNCLRIPPDDPDALADAVRRLADDPDLRARLTEAGHRTADELDVDRVNETLASWHLAAAEGFPEGPPEDRPAPTAGLSRPSGGGART